MIKINLKVGDTILAGKWKNKKIVVKSIDKDEYENPIINGKIQILKIRIPKLYQKESISMKLKDLIESVTEPIYKGDLLKVKVLSGYGKTQPSQRSGIHSTSKIGYAIVSALAFKKDKKFYNLGVRVFYEVDPKLAHVGKKWRSVFVKHFDTKNIIEKISINEIPKDLRPYIKGE